MEVKQSQPGDEPGTHPGRARRLWVVAVLLMALAQVLWAGYQWGAGNQSIQIPFLKKCIDPQLYSRDPMVNETIRAYPTWFFRALGLVLPVAKVPAAYLWLHGLTALAVLAAVYLLARAYGRDDWAGLVAILLLWAGHHRSLTGEELYLRAFTHTWATFPLAIGALVCFYRGRHLAAWTLAGVLFNFHALTSLYLAVLLGAGLIGARTKGNGRDARATVLPGTGLIGARRELAGWKLTGLAAAFLLTALPTLWPLLAHPQTFDAVWLGLTRIRSAGHAFLSNGWQAGNPDIPRFVLIAGAGALALSYPLADEQRRKTWWLLAGAAVLLVVGYLGSELWPVPVLVRAQLFRSSRLVLVVLLVAVAHGLVCGWRMPFRDNAGWARWQSWLEFANATVLACCLAVPPFLPMLPVAFAGAILVAVINGRLSRLQALLAGLALVVTGAAHRAVAFPWTGYASTGGPGDWLALGVLACGVLVWLAAQTARSDWTRRFVAAAGLLGAVAAAGILYFGETAGFTAGDSWMDVQRWVRDHTPRDALILTPIQPGGFRVESERSVVGEWRDGTQMFFAAGFADPWWARMTALQPGLVADRQAGTLLARGRPLDSLEDPAIVDLCHRFGATHVVLPAARRGRLSPVYHNRDWAVCRPFVPDLRAATGPEAAAQREQFFREVVLPNIEKYRRSDATLQVVDADGRPFHGLAFAVRQTRHRFQFSASLPFFVNPRGDAGPDFKPPPVTDAELARFPEIFNFSLIPYSGKWLYVEPDDGQREYADLDRYVAWCREHDIGMEYHFVSGYAPAWLGKKPAPEQGERFLAHARGLIERYGSRVAYWQVVNEKHLLQQSPPVFREFRRLLPQARLGISDCANFYSTDPPARRLQNLCRGLEEIRWLKKQGITLDFFGFHGHRPFGAWPDPREMYECLDAFAKEGVKLHITEFALPLGGPIIGYGPKGKWTPELQAQYYEWFYTVCFSHPAVEMINLWGFGPANWQPGTGLLDDHYQPKPAFYALRRLIQERWHTEQRGELGLDGSVTLRGFHGDYELTLELATNQTVRTTFAIEPGARNRYRFRLDRDTGTIAPE